LHISPLNIDIFEEFLGSYNLQNSSSIRGYNLNYTGVLVTSVVCTFTYAKSGVDEDEYDVVYIGL